VFGPQKFSAAEMALVTQGHWQQRRFIDHI